MQTKLTYFGQHFHLSDETRNQVVPVDIYELKEVADFINKYLKQNNDTDTHTGT